MELPYGGVWVVIRDSIVGPESVLNVACCVSDGRINVWDVYCIWLLSGMQAIDAANLYMN